MTGKIFKLLLWAGFIALTLGGTVSAQLSTERNRPVVVLETNQGVIEIELYNDVAPKTCENFIGLINKKYYDGLIFHRCIKNFMIQGGDPTGTGRGGESPLGREI